MIVTEIQFQNKRRENFIKSLYVEFVTWAIERRTSNQRIVGSNQTQPILFFTTDISLGLNASVLNFDYMLNLSKLKKIQSSSFFFSF